MAAAPEVMAAFESGSGVSGSVSHDVIVTTLCAITLIWLTWAVLGIGTRYLDKRMTLEQATLYLIRSAVLACLVVYSLLQ
jgi:integrating conjugative element protein (TIGR03758 family)